MTLSACQKFSYSVGHVLNDLCASMWFTYLLLFFHKVLEFSNSMAGNIILIGQVADGLATPLVGYESDKSFIVCKYGKRKSWHLVGTFCVAAAFPLLFIRCISCDSETPEYAQLIYYAPLVVIFQFGWATTQINHLALIPDLTHNDGDKITLNALRYSFTVFSSILVYSIAWLVLETPKQSTSEDSNHDVSPKDAPSFMILALTVVGIGIIFSAIFHFGLKENNDNQNDDLLTNGEKNGITEARECPCENTPLITRSQSVAEDYSSSIVHWYDWFKRVDFYQMALLYMCTRLVVNLSQVYMPMYLTDTLQLHKKFIAIVPLTTYVSSFCAAMIIRPISHYVKQELIYISGCLFVIGSCVWGRYVEEGSMQIFGQAILLGFGTSIILVVSLSMAARLIGKESATGAFVYGALSLTDKISNGVAVVLIQYLNPCLCDCPDCAIYFRTVMTYLLGGITVAAFLTLLSISITKKRRRSTNTEHHNDAAVTT